MHWKKRDEGEVADLFLKALVTMKATTSKRIIIEPHNREGFIRYLLTDFVKKSDKEEQRLAVGVVGTVLGNLEPIGRNKLLSHQEEIVLRQTVSNIDTKKDLYKDLGVPKDAPVAVVAQKFAEQKAVLEASTTPEAKVELEKISYANNVLTDVVTRARYDTSLIEPTVFSHVVGSDMLYIAISQIAPTTMDEFLLALARASTTPGLTHLVIDLRGNRGGALAFPLSFFGSYLGKGVTALSAVHQDATSSDVTILDKSPLLDRFTKQIVIIDRGTQSTAEATASVFKQHHLATIIGENSAGWGTVENTFPMQTIVDASTTYTLFLVHSLVLRYDDLPVDGRGIVPDIDVTKPGWDKVITEKFSEATLVDTLRGILVLPPERW
jgi:C-terminal processing protease CtpA/Prc